MGSPAGARVIPILRALERTLRHVEDSDASGVLPACALPTSLSSLDELGLLTAPSYTLLFGAPGAGCTSLALSFASASAYAHHPVLVVSWESGSDDLMRRVLAARARVPLPAVRAGELTDDQWMRLAATADWIAKADVNVAAGPRTLVDTESVVREWRGQHGDVPALVILDGLTHLSRLDLTGGDVHGRVSAMVRHLAQDLGVAVVASVPANGRTLEVGVPLRLADVGYSSAYVQDADTVVAVHREHGRFAGEVDLDVLKARHVPTGRHRVAFLSEFARFADEPSRDDMERPSGEVAVLAHRRS